VNLLAGAKTQANPESCVGVLSLAGKVPKMLVTPTPDLGKVLNSMHDVPLDSMTHVTTGVQVSGWLPCGREGAQGLQAAAPCGLPPLCGV
jgi:hypothetical protein